MRIITRKKKIRDGDRGGVKRRRNRRR